LTGKLLFSLYTKPTGNAGYLLSTSNHPQWIFKNIPKSIFIRIRRNCSLYTDYLYHSRNVIFQLIKQKYPLNQTLAIMNSIGKKSRKNFLSYNISNKQTNPDTRSFNIWFNVEFNKNSLDFTKKVSNAFNSISKAYNWLDNVNFKVYNSIAPNLISLLIFGHKLKQPSRFTTKSCKLISCKICNFIYRGSFISLNNGLILPIQSNGNCTSLNAIYIIKCDLCNLFYVGQTGQKIKIRLSQHIRSINKFKPYYNYTTEVGYHFNLKHHEPNIHFKFTIFKHDIENKEERLQIEAHLIHLINKFNGPIINAFIPNHSTCKRIAFT
jgi:hypothetical protein